MFRVADGLSKSRHTGLGGMDGPVWRLLPIRYAYLARDSLNKTCISESLSGRL
jgi:hypothetical protein